MVNMTGTRFCDSAGVHVLVGAHKRAVTQGGELLLVMPARVLARRVLALTGIDRLIPSCADLNEALEQALAAVPGTCNGGQRGVRIRTGEQPPGPGAAPNPA